MDLVSPTSGTTAIETRVASLEHEVAVMRARLNVSVGVAATMPPVQTSQVRNLILSCSLSPGDVVTMTAAVKWLHESNPGKFRTDVRTPCPQLWEHNPYVTPIPDGTPGVEKIPMEYPAIHSSNQAPFHFIHGYAMFLAEKLAVKVRPTSFKGDIYVSAQERGWINQVQEITGTDVPFWLIVNGGKSDFTAKHWDPARNQEVVDHFVGRVQFVQIGAAEHMALQPPLRNVIDLRGKTDIRQMVRLMYHATGVVCPVTFHMHLAAAVATRPDRPPNRPCVVIAGGREPTQWEAYPHHQYIHTLGMLPCCQDGGCWKSRVVALPDGEAEKNASICLRPVRIQENRWIPQCLDMIKASDVILAIERYLDFGASYIEQVPGVPITANHSIIDSAAQQPGVDTAVSLPSGPPEPTERVPPKPASNRGGVGIIATGERNCGGETQQEGDCGGDGRPCGEIGTGSDSDQPPGTTPD